MNKILIVTTSAQSVEVAGKLLGDYPEARLVSHHEWRTAVKPEEFDAWIFIGAMGICVRAIAPWVKDKYHDPAVVCIDSLGRQVISVLSGHVGGANALTRDIAASLGANPVITTQTDGADLWQIDLWATQYGWTPEASKADMNRAIFALTNGEPVALVLEVKDRGTADLETTLPSNVKVYKNFNEIPTNSVRAVLIVSPFCHSEWLAGGENGKPVVVCFRPRVLALGMGCRKQCPVEGIPAYVADELRRQGLSPLAVRTVATIELKKYEPLLTELQTHFGAGENSVYPAEELKDIEVPNPSEKAFEVTGVYGVAEAAALRAADGGPLLLPKQKGKLQEGADFTFAVAMDADSVRGGHIEIVGAGPGDPELVSVRGKRFLQLADLILYAGSLVPRELTRYAKPGCTVRSSADMNLEEQFELMKNFYDRGLLVVRLHTGDPCIYGAIQEQMAYFDRYGMRYHITPGISSFQAAAAALRSQFTIPERVQSIILTRGEGRTPMPEREQLHKLAQSQSTMCIYLSAAIVEKVQEELLQCYPPTTPVAACYKLTWPEERIYRGQLSELAQLVRDNHLTLTTLLVVGEAIDNRQGLSRLYADEFKHLYRK
jgi:precorrin-4 C11-methyltransferase